MPTYPIQLKRNGTAAATPSSLLHGEVALNYADGKLFWKDASNVIQSFTFQAYALSSHTHAASDITSGTLDAARLPLATTIAAGAVIVGTGLGVSSGTVSVTYGTTSGTACQGNDSRLSDARTPTSHSHGNITNAGAIGSTANLPVITTTSGVLTTGSFGTSAATFCEGNDSRLSDTRTPTDGSVTTAKIANDAVTYAKLQNVSATDRLLGRSSAGSGDVEEIVCTAFGRSLIDDADAAAARTTLSVQPTASPAFTGTVSAAAANFTGAVSVTSPLTLTGTVAGNVRQLKLQTSGVDRWQITPGFDAESGSNAGSTLWITRWSDAGAFLGTPISIARATGVVTIESGLIGNGSATFNNTGNVVPLTVTNTGTANSFVVNDASGDTTPFVIDANGRVVIGGTAASSEGDVVSVINAAAATGNVSRLFVARASAPSSSTSAHNGFQSSIGTDAASFTVSALRHFIATQGTLGAGSSVTDQYGFAALSTITGATNNYGFYSDIASGTGRWNFYANGTAASFFGGQVQISAGSASACGVAFSGDTNTGLAQIGGADTASLVTAGVERVRCTSGGTIEVRANSGSISHGLTYNENGGEIVLYDETQTAATLIDQISTDTRVLELVNGSNLKLGLGSGNTTGSIQFMRAGYVESVVINSSGQLLVTTGSGSAGSYKPGIAVSGDDDTGLQQVGGANTISIVTNGSERVRVDAVGGLRIGGSADVTVSDERLSVLGGAIGVKTSVTVPVGVWNTNTSGTRQYIYFYVNTGTLTGTINTDGTTTAYNTTSDYRLKTVLRALPDATQRLESLLPCEYVWKSTGLRGEGFLAHELAESVPHAVSGTKDAVTDDGAIDPQQVDLSKIVPLLVKALQESNARIAALEEMINA